VLPTFRARGHSPSLLSLSFSPSCLCFPFAIASLPRISRTTLRTHIAWSYLLRYSTSRNSSRSLMDWWSMRFRSLCVPLTEVPLQMTITIFAHYFPRVPDEYDSTIVVLTLQYLTPGRLCTIESAPLQSNGDFCHTISRLRYVGPNL